VRTSAICTIGHQVAIRNEAGAQLRRTSVEGYWDIRGRLDEYIEYPLVGKTPLDVGTATGFLAFSAEAAGARVTALDAPGSEEFQRVPFGDPLYHRDRSTWISHIEATSNRPLRNGYWHAWHKLQSRVEVISASAVNRRLTK
jgi:O-methyltransferase